MLIANIDYAKTHLCELIEYVQQNEKVLMYWEGDPVAFLVPYNASNRPRQLGLWAGRIKIADDFDEALPE